MGGRRRRTLEDALKSQILSFIDALRSAGVAAAVAETLDATSAVATVGLERAVFREALAATLIKDEAQRPIFESVFDHFFAVPKRARPRKGGHQPNDPEQTGGAGTAGDPTGLRGGQRPGELQSPAPLDRREARECAGETRAGRRLARRTALERTTFQEMSSREVAACDLLATELARRLRRNLSRRQRAAHRDRLDIRRTLRRSTGTGGVPIYPALRRRRPGRPDLIALCDHSYSVATASHFLIALLLPSASFFRHVHLYAFVDRPVEVSIEHGHLVPHTPLDLYARSDLGHVFVQFWEEHRNLVTRNTTVLILGDARNNRKPPRADILAKIHAAAARVVWLNPEPGQRWNTGDSVIGVYSKHCDDMLAAGSFHSLANALAHAFRTL